MIIPLLSTFIVLLMLVWFNTDFVIDFGNLFGLFKKLEREYFHEKLKNLPVFINFPTFLNHKYDNFLTKLFSCRLCFSFWLSILLSIIVSILIHNPTFIFFVPALCITSLFIYGVITKLVNI
jgi:hypothetical protein